MAGPETGGAVQRRRVRQRAGGLLLPQPVHRGRPPALPGKKDRPGAVLRATAGRYINKKTAVFSHSGLFVVRPTGFEPAAFRVGEPRHAMEKGSFKPFLLIVHKCGNHTKSSRSRLDTDFAGFCMGRGQMVVMVGNLA